MIRLPHKPWSVTRLLAHMLVAASIGITLMVIYYVANIQVIKDWRLTLPKGDIHVGDTIIVDSTYTKLRQVTGKSVRSLECQSDPGVFVSYPLNAVPANRAPGHTGTGIVVVLDKSIRSLPALPATCHICVALTYPVLPGRTVPYFKCTKTFRLFPAVSSTPATTTATANAEQPSQQTSPAPARAPSPGSSATGNVSSSSSQSAPANQQTQPDNSQPAGINRLLHLLTSAL